MPLSSEAYAEVGSRCPVCGSINIEWDGTAEPTDCRSLSQAAHCLNCHAGWYEIYNLVGVRRPGGIRMSFPCYNSIMADRYADECGKEDAYRKAIEDLADELGDLPQAELRRRLPPHFQESLDTLVMEAAEYLIDHQEPDCDEPDDVEAFRTRGWM